MKRRLSENARDNDDGKYATLINGELCIETPLRTEVNRVALRLRDHDNSGFTGVNHLLPSILLPKL